MSNKKTILLTSLFLVLVCLGAGCGNNNEDSSIDTNSGAISNVDSESEIEEDVLTTTTNNIIDKYAKNLDSAKIKILDEEECNQKEKNIKDYVNGIYNYEFKSIKEYPNGKITGDFNGDNENDYIVQYTYENCWDGIGAGNFLSNSFFLTTKDNKVSIDEELTTDFKQQLISVITKDFGNVYYKKPQKQLMINGIEFKEIKNQKVFGTFNINTEKCSSAQPCFQGEFEYNVKNNLLKMTLTQ